MELLNKPQKLEKIMMIADTIFSSKIMGITAPLLLIGTMGTYFAVAYQKNIDIEEKVNKYMQVYDTNLDGVLQKEEFGNLLKYFDRNKDGVINKKEMDNLIYSYDFPRVY